MNIYPPRVLTETWLFIALSTQYEYETARVLAMNNIIKTFGNIVVAEMYLETFSTYKYSKSA
ncbi:hypothetical protein A3Q33_12555 [Colwellia sp. PAMC 21821]|nr:hypothetical protein A3Q33_12555 [Colwellia sp. PAMC 21821]